MPVVKILGKISNWLDCVCGAALVVCLVAMVALTGAQIAFRLAGSALSWSEEVTRYLLVWATFLGASCVYKRTGHISVTVVQNLVPPGMRSTMQIACHLLCGAFFLVSVVCGVDYMDLQSGQLSAALRIPMSWVYLAIPAGCGVAAFHVAFLLASMLPAARRAEESGT